MPEQGGSERGFTVIDRRGARGEPAAEPSATSRAAPARELPAVDFASFVVSLGTSALYHMGLVDGPEGGRRSDPDLPLARQTIDTLEMLQAKTRGNLDESEQRLLENLLYELRMRFVEVTR
jgi:hypothetical protein